MTVSFQAATPEPACSKPPVAHLCMRLRSSAMYYTIRRWSGSDPSHGRNSRKGRGGLVCSAASGREA
ncbi:hypothetical protein B0H67DRAFT_594172 [Lasiosphaeris hirsuta]|uniref:Uncharacterized protein n=1 Tax=Lasiosphaeris hirsuta TaxID=260670 RepID=A0AA39ZXI7_9PEZI|nr:hypothetical protein B0H67DRAFT_594172 [Lasiosphaeris hirsuta]